MHPKKTNSSGLSVLEQMQNLSPESTKKEIETAIENFATEQHEETQKKEKWWFGGNIETENFLKPSEERQIRAEINDYLNEENLQNKNIFFSVSALLKFQQKREKKRRENPYGVNTKEEISELVTQKMEQNVSIENTQKKSSQKKQKNASISRMQKKKKKKMSAMSKGLLYVGGGILGLGFLV